MESLLEVVDITERLEVVIFGAAKESRVDDVKNDVPDVC